jgi:glycerol transport system ATP-binding protein
MASIVLEGIAHAYGSSHADGSPHADGSSQAANYALKSIDHLWEDGGAYALLGPSGCGKTTLLNIISGLITPSRGRVLFNQQDVTFLPTEQRNIAQVFQFPVVYDTMTVAENLMFPLRNRNLPKIEREARVREVMSMLELTALAGKKARALGADIKQKISLGRGLVRTDANAILFDEPLTVIDPELKWQLRAQLKKVHQQFHHTMIYVTHDQTEALTFADKVVVMLAGEVLQIGTPEQLFNSPAHTFVGRFIGSPGMNILPCEVNGQCATIGTHRIPLGKNYPASAFNAKPGRLELGIRPEYIDLVESTGNEGAVPATIRSIDDLGRFKIVQLELDQHREPILVQVLVKHGIALPSSPALFFRPEHVKIYADSVLLTGAGEGAER